MSNKPADKPKRGVEEELRKLLDGGTPFTATLRQTQSRNELKIFTTKNHEEDAVHHAQKIAAKGGIAFVLTPFTAYEPEIGVKAIDMPWKKDDGG